MKKFLASLFCLVLLLTTVVPDIFGQDRRRRARNRNLRTAAMIAGGTAAGALIGRGRGAAIGGGAAALYAMNRRVARRHYSRRTRQIGTVAGGTVAGAGIGSAVGGRRAATVGALAGAGTSYIYTRRSRSYRQRRIARRN